ncbi:hypothetical protein [Alloactinosynnema sp. L-07]|uniref:hypothetical protein n=1 Tax=Alloactinosynnema sp. L-07 TaxID=1653480 RepID=UPI00065EF1E4|nr:hypothetical protein [Alloactinosynnema sp. L-07]CRK55384.1 hypothetical protein [Alloactinosynnema sp. L-07]
MERLITPLTYAAVGLAILLVLWPTVSTGQRFLCRWGVPDPDEQQAVHAVAYLRNRRLLYPPLFLLAPVLIAPASGDSSPLTFLAPLIAGLLVAEAIASLRPPRGPRVATLVRRHWRDVVPRWAMATLLALASAAVALAVAGLIAQTWADRVSALLPADGVWRSADGSSTWSFSGGYATDIGRPTSLFALVGIAVGVAAVLGLVRLAVRRGPVGDPRVDAALRTRTARVAVGIGIAWMAAMVMGASNRLQFLRHFMVPPGFPQAPGWLAHTSATDLTGVVVLFVAAAGWIWAANPPRRLPYVRAAA